MESMAIIFFIMSGAMVAVFCGKRKWAIGLLLFGIFCCWLMLGHHATNELKINW